MSKGHEDIPTELAALADGTLAPARREELRGRVAASPELAALLVEQERVVSAMRSVTVTAPASLRGEIRAMQANARPPRRRLALGGALAGALAAAAAVAVVVIPGGAASLNVVQAADLALRPAMSAAPGEDPAHRNLLSQRIEGVAYPYWGDRFAWRASGTRSDVLHGRRAMTVFYRNAAGRQVGYSIFAGHPISASGGATLARNGVSLRVIEHGGRTIVTWLRQGHTCVLSGSGVPTAALTELASWTAGGEVR